jgi:hypothetical protein
VYKECVLLRALYFFCLVFALPSFGDIAVAGKSRGSRVKKPPREKHDAMGFIILNGERTEVRWTDGDSFSIKEGARKGMGSAFPWAHRTPRCGCADSWR